jgi:hypothetical protein
MTRAMCRTRYVVPLDTHWLNYAAASQLYQGLISLQQLPTWQ